MKTAYEKAVEAGTATYNWVASKSREAQNIVKNWNKTLEENMKHVCESVKYAGDQVINTLRDVDWKEIGSKALDGVQTVLDVVGLVPGVGEIADGVNAVVYLGRGDIANAALSGAAMVPFAGWAATGGKLATKAVKYGDDVIDVGKAVVKHGDEAAEVVAGVAKSGGMKLDLQFFAEKTVKKVDDVGDVGGSKLGGAYKDIPANGGQRHHMPADSVSPYSKKDGPAVVMDTMDHMETASWGNSKRAQEHREMQKRLINQGEFKEAQQMDIDDIKNKFGNKYDQGIIQMEKYTEDLLKGAE